MLPGMAPIAGGSPALWDVVATEPALVSYRVAEEPIDASFNLVSRRSAAGRLYLAVDHGSSAKPCIWELDTTTGVGIADFGTVNLTIYSGAPFGDAGAIAFSTDGVSLFMVLGNRDVLRVTLASPFAIDTPTAYQTIYDGPSNFSAYHGFAYDADGLSFFAVYGSALQRRAVAAPFTGAPATLMSSFDLPDDPPATGFAIAPHGGRLHVIGQDGLIRQYTLATPWDLATAAFDGSYDYATPLAAPFGGPFWQWASLAWDDDGRAFYVTATGAFGGSVVAQFDVA